MANMEMPNTGKTERKFASADDVRKYILATAVGFLATFLTAQAQEKPGKFENVPTPIAKTLQVKFIEIGNLCDSLLSSTKLLPGARATADSADQITFRYGDIVICKKNIEKDTLKHDLTYDNTLIMNKNDTTYFSSVITSKQGAMHISEYHVFSKGNDYKSLLSGKDINIPQIKGDIVLFQAGLDETAKKIEDELKKITELK